MRPHEVVLLRTFSDRIVLRRFWTKRAAHKYSDAMIDFLTRVGQEGCHFGVAQTVPIVSWQGSR